MKRESLSHISDVIDNSLTKLSLSGRLKEYKLHLAWPEIVGPLIAKRTAPVKLIRKTLYVNVSSQTWMTELQYQKIDIIEKIKEEFDAEFVNEIIFRFGSLTRPAVRKNKPIESKEEATVEHKAYTSEFIDKTVTPVKDAELRELIRRTMSKGRT
jgi:predicted nucleic acid-binding Zn ribbon protein